MEDKIKLCLFAGHCLKEPGACCFGLREHDEAQKVVRFMIPAFKDEFDVITFEADPDMTESETLIKKVNIIKEFNPKFSIDFHLNAGGGTGVESIVHPDSSLIFSDMLNLADSMNEAMTTLGLKNRGFKPAYYAGDPTKIDYFVRKNPGNAFIFEMLFIDNVNDVRLLKNNEHMKIASTIVLGIQRVLNIIKLDPQIRGE